MIFQRNTDILSIRNFYITTGGYDKAIAYGPGSIINGSLMITNDKPLSAYNLRIVFKCEEVESSKKETTTTIFSVDSIIWGNSREDKQQLPNELSTGSHMYLFAIRLPQVNYPPSIHRSHFAHHRISYSLQAFLDLVSTSSPYAAPLIPILYLPFVTSQATPSKRMTQLWLFHQKEEINKRIGIVAELIKSAYCPGDLCTVKMTTNNKSGTKISSVQLSLVAVVTTIANSSSDTSSSNTIPNDEGDGNEMIDYLHKRHTLLTESFYVSIPKDAAEHQDVFQFHLPVHLVPTFTNKMGKYIDIAYEVNITIVPHHHHGSSLLFHHNNTVVVTDDTTAAESNTISLPIIIGTVPPTYPLSSQPKIEDESTALPTFIPNIESPLPSPALVNDGRAYSVSPSNSFQILSEDEEMDELVLNRNSVQQDANGHLMVPEAITTRH
ncbi:MAG: hypothetical protein EXX96DRAFT_525187 [Benjaminiella poitrasii]|nr:MAG: hypothetical protein EXX96DRAFT_525187 [Benjaminiella poitrasii]